jgi:hypothetical protein
MLRRITLLAALALLATNGQSQSQLITAPVTLTASSQTSTPISLGSSYAAGTILLSGNNLTTATFAVYGCSVASCAPSQYLPLAIQACTVPGTYATTQTATANGCYQVNLAGMTSVEYVTSGTFTGTSITLTLTASPNAQISRGGSGGGGGSGTVTSVSVTTANGVSGTVATATTTPAISLTLGAITPTSVAASGPVSGGNASANAIAALPAGTAGVSGDEGSTVGVPHAAVDYLRWDSTLHGPKWSANNSAEELFQHAWIASTAVTPGSYTNANITVAADGSITAAANGTGAALTPIATTGALYVVPTGPATATTTSGSTTNSATTVNVASTTGYAIPTSSNPLYLIMVQNNFTPGEVVSATGETGTSFTGLTRNLCGTTAANPTPTSTTVVEISAIIVGASGAPCPMIQYWKQGTAFWANGDGLDRAPTGNGVYDDYNLNVAGNISTDGGSLGITNGNPAPLNCATSGTAQFTIIQNGGSFKQVHVRLAACLGTVTYNLGGVTWNNAPSLNVTSTVVGSILTSSSVTSVTLTGATTTGDSDLTGN